MPDERTYQGDGGIGGNNELYGPLNGWNLLDRATGALAEKIEDKGIDACPASLQADLLILNQLEQINTGTANLQCSIENFEECVMGALRELIELAKHRQCRACETH